MKFSSNDLPLYVTSSYSSELLAESQSRNVLMSFCSSSRTMLILLSSESFAHMQVTLFPLQG